MVFNLVRGSNLELVIYMTLDGDQCYVGKKGKERGSGRGESRVIILLEWDRKILLRIILSKVLIEGRELVKGKNVLNKGSVKVLR